MTEEEKKTRSFEDYKWLLRIVAIIFLLCAIGAIAVFAFQKTHQEKIYSKIKVGHVKLSKLTIDQASENIEAAFNDTYGKGYAFIYGDKEVNFSNDYEIIQGVERSILEVDYKATAEKAYWIGRSGKAIIDLKDQVFMLITAKKIDPVFEFDRGYLKEKLIENFKEFEDRAEPARLEVKVVSEKNKEVKINIIDEKEGVKFDYDKLVDQLIDYINNYENQLITLKLESDTPSILKTETQQAVQKAKEIVDAGKTITFKHEENVWEAEWNEYALWLALKKDNDKTNLIFDEEKFYEFLEPIAERMDVSAKNARFELKNGKVEEFQASENGQAINKKETYNKLVENFFDFNSMEMDLVVEEKMPDVTSENINDMGVRELIGVGESNFSGSPANRRYNIKVGSDKLHGLLINPGETFSLTGTLGHISGATGYLPELVIKGNKTIPEYGGGLCQVATTMFRVAINSGLPVTERKPHSYRVSYYEPAGFDSTIYDPSPDLKFINDTGQYILIQTQINGNILRYEFWGTDDGRKIEVTKPSIFNITYPGPTKIIESPDLAPGQRKCTERAHNGADAVFYRTITNASGDVNKETWSSTYRPWQAVCLVGPEVEGDGGDESPDTEPAPDTPPAAPQIPETPAE